MRLLPAIVVSNESTVLTDAEVQAALPALQHQITYHFRPYWNVGARLLFAPKGVPSLKGAWLSPILDDSDQAGALGYHDFTEEGLPVLKTFAKTDEHYDLSWTVTLSHELLEALADPDISRGYQVNNQQWYALEVGDPVEADKFGYKIGDTLVSDFVLPGWYLPWAKVLKYSYNDTVKSPLEIAEGGYVSIYEDGGWVQKQMRGGQTYQVPLETEDPRFRNRGNRN